MTFLEAISQLEHLPYILGQELGDIIHYRTKKGNNKRLIYGKQTWYGHECPFRQFMTERKGQFFRVPTLAEVISETFKSMSKKLYENLTDKNPLWEAIKNRI